MSLLRPGVTKQHKTISYCGRNVLLTTQLTNYAEHFPHQMISPII